MGKVNDAKRQALGFLSALRTMLDNYPQPKLDRRLQGLLDSNTPFGFLMNLLAICGVSEEKLLNWVAKILCGKEVIKNQTKKANKFIEEKSKNAKETKGGQGILDTIEYAVKTILLLNVKNMFTCSLNPLIPNEILSYPNGYTNGIIGANGKGIKIPISTIDLFNTLDYCPTDKKSGGKSFYFDNDYTTNEIWKSTDFNAFLWYVINKATYIEDEKLKCVWDNRVWKRDELMSNEVFKNNFFNLGKGDGSFVKKNTAETNVTTANYPNKPSDRQEKKEAKKDSDQIKKKQYIMVEYNERDSISNVPNSLTIWLNADRYRYFNKEPFYLNKTVFEFNYDFIFSLKLFDSQVIVANVINALLGLAKSATAALLSGKYSLQQKVIEGQVGKVVKELMNGEDTVINDCFFSFSNDELNSLLEETEVKRYNNYQFGDTLGTISDEDAATMINDINNIGNASTLNEVQTNIANVFTNVAEAVAAQNDSVEISDKFSFRANIILKIIEQCVTQIVLQVLSPKVMLLFAVNSYFMGDVTDGDFSKINVGQFLKGLSNLISSIVKQVFDMIIKELIQFLLNEILPLIMLMIEKLLLERIRFYIDLFKRLLNLMKMFMNAFNNAFNNGRGSGTVIDNVDFADIVPMQTEPPKETSMC